ncbi:dehydrogenase/reductase SDR family member on chromosome X [Grammomys surdaster]|uniref:dehydrogenase/reductase SDR family member on chromosome X n=1 Tax=Grammomys surdaster TaxID=491861 RepID=UPI00109F0EA1|nr:dehydrogenase/reductase SDR family member on chromosome X [Grammomys surdaster]
MFSLRALAAALRVYAVGIAVALAQLLRRLRGDFQPPDLPPQPGRVAVVTGGAEGIGLSTARRLARLGMRVVVAGNDERKGRAAVDVIRAESGADSAHFLFLELASLASVRRFVREFEASGRPLHVLVNNAGVMLEPRGETEDGFERHAGVNFLGHFLLTLLLLPALRASGRPGRGSRVVTLGSATHRVAGLDPRDLRGRLPYSAHAAYAGSKLALALFALRLQRLLDARGDPVTSNLADPGVADTALYRHAWAGLRAARRALGRLAFKTPDEAAWTPAYAAAAAELEGVGGRYLYDEAEAEPAEAARNRALQRALWAEACRATGLEDETAGCVCEAGRGRAGPGRALSGPLSRFLWDGRAWAAPGLCLRVLGPLPVHKTHFLSTKSHFPSPRPAFPAAPTPGSRPAPRGSARIPQNR